MLSGFVGNPAFELPTSTVDGSNSRKPGILLGADISARTRQALLNGLKPETEKILDQSMQDPLDLMLPVSDCKLAL
jgi:hypothetical protein